MKKVWIIIFLLLFYGISEAGKQIVVRQYDQIKYGGRGEQYYRGKRCQEYCGDRSVDINSLLEKGWKVISSRGVVIRKRPFGDGRGVHTGFCKCIGAEYILER